ncbi:hypothetical protein BRC68_14535 [Halobacteriales archaeon QH_6_64_20]|nr:MAG: hypothetical protein BRC68_14535 [Halobacteriales archaeon QH_6_64_20]
MSQEPEYEGPGPATQRSGRNGPPTETESSRSRRAKAALTIGFAALTVAVLSAYLKPMTGYELSIYAATPLAFWVGVAVALLVSLWYSFAPGGRGRVWLAALALGGTAGVAIAGLPLIRSYFFIGSADALTHLGWVNELLAGVLNPFEFLYPGMHLIAASISTIGGVNPPLALQYAVLAFVPVYLVFVPLCVRVASGHRWALPAGLFAALLFLPISNISVYLQAYPTTQAIMLAPLVLFAMFQYVIAGRTRAEDRPEGRSAVGDGGVEGGEPRRSLRVALSRFGPITPTGILLVVGATGLLFVHPQQAVNVLAIYVLVSTVQFFYRRYDDDHPVVAHRPLYLQTVLFGLVFTAWIVGKERVSGNAARTFELAIGTLLGTNITGDEVTSRGDSLLAVGGSIPELFIKIFGVSTVFAGLAGLFMLASATGRLEDSLPDRNAIGKYLTAAFVPLIGLFVVYIVSSHSVFYFRQAGFIMLIVTLMSGVLIARGTTVLSRSISTRRALLIIGVCFAIALPLSIVTVYSSPYIYQPSSGVTDSYLSGHETAFENRATGVEYAGIRGGPQRAADGIYGNQTVVERFGGELEGPETSVPPDALRRGLPGYYNESHYVFVTTEDFLRDAVLYDGFRYSGEAFGAFASTPGVHRVQSNGEIRLYFVAANDSTVAAGDVNGTGATNATAGPGNTTEPNGTAGNATTGTNVTANATGANATGANATATNVTTATGAGTNATNATAGTDTGTSTGTGTDTNITDITNATDTTSATNATGANTTGANATDTTNTTAGIGGANGTTGTATGTNATIATGNTTTATNDTTTNSTTTATNSTTDNAGTNATTSTAAGTNATTGTDNTTGA